MNSRCRNKNPLFNVNKAKLSYNRNEIKNESNPETNKIFTNSFLI